MTSDLFIQLHRTVNSWDIITIKPDGTLLLNGVVQTDEQMEMM